ncbi:MAG TPA: heavy metal translocating P-type ATPase [Paludibaculum sp.]|jgi:heavy metal translocating P-type ATPase
MATAPAQCCDLCGLPAGRHPLLRKFDAVEKAFCCLGCMNVYTILLESGVVAQGGDFRDSEVYRQSLKLGLISNGAARRVEIPADAETREAMFHVSGMWCGSCGWLIEHALTAESGIVSADVMFASDMVKVRYCPQYVPPGRIIERVASLGYRAKEYSGDTEVDRSERRDLLLRIGVSAFLWMNVMTLSLVIYASYWEAISETARHVVPAVLMALTAPAIFYSAWPILRVAFLGLRQGALRMEALLALGILAAYIYSSAQAIVGGKHYYFDTACAIITLVLLGKLLERGAKERTTQAIAMLYRMMPKKARLMAEGREHFVSIEALLPGSVFVVKAGERIPADGTVEEGTSHVDESVLTGESAPREKSPGCAVIGGSLNAGGVLHVRATRLGSESTLTQIIRSVEAAMSSRAPIERVVDRVSRVFVPVVVMVAGVTLAASLWLGVPQAEALMRTIAVLVIACPCALGIATPLAITSAVGAASRRGILVRDSRVLEEIENVDLIVLDKTGTVTEGDFRLVGLECDCLAEVAAVEAFSEHPLARAVMAEARRRDLTVPEAKAIEVSKGAGIAGRVGEAPVAVGNRRMMAEHGVDPGTRGQAWEQEGHTVAFVAVDGHCRGVLAFGDQVRAEARTFVAEMRARGIETLLVSGDAQTTTERVAGQIGASGFRAEVLPDGKRALVEEMRGQGRVVAMIGDGVNDAPALAAAQLGIAMGSGADLAMQAAPVVLMSSNLRHAGEVFDLSRQALRIVRQNLFWAFFYNVGGIALAVTGVLNPILAAGAMVLSSLSVIGNSLRLRRYFS